MYPCVNMQHASDIHNGVLQAVVPISLIDPKRKRRMSHFIRGIFVLAVGYALLALFLVLMIGVGCRFSSCDL